MKKSGGKKRRKGVRRRAVSKDWGRSWDWPDVRLGVGGWGVTQGEAKRRRLSVLI